MSARPGPERTADGGDATTRPAADSVDEAVDDSVDEAVGEAVVGTDPVVEAPDAVEEDEPAGDDVEGDDPDDATAEVAVDDEGDADDGAVEDDADDHEEDADDDADDEETAQVAEPVVGDAEAAEDGPVELLESGDVDDPGLDEEVEDASDELDEDADEDQDEGEREDQEEDADEDEDEARVSADFTADVADDPLVVAPAPLSGPPLSGPPLPGPRPFPRDPADAARRRLRRALVPRLTRSQLLAAAVCASLGFAVAVQVNQAQEQSLSSLRQADLITVLDNVTQEGARLEDQAASLRQTLDQLRSSSDNAPAAREAAQTRLDALGVLAGTLPATGPGIELDITDPQAAVQANDLLETVQELRDAGAEAMQIGSVRVVARTAFVDVGGGMLIDKQLVRPPYRLVAIGDPQTLSAALEIPGGVLEVLRGRGGRGTVRTQSAVTVSALLPQRAPQYARPATSPSP